MLVLSDKPTIVLELVFFFVCEIVAGNRGNQDNWGSFSPVLNQL